VFDSLGPLRIRDVRIYMAGQTVSLIGIWMQQTAQSWVVWELSGSGTALGLAAMLSFLPLLILGPFMGVLADRLDRRRVLLATQTAAMALAFVFGALVQTGLIQLWHVYVLAAALGVVGALDFPATQAFIGDLAGMERVREAIILNATIFQVSRMVGPAFAGWAIGYLGTASAFWANGVTFLAVIGSLLVIRGHQVRRASSGRPSAEIREGFRFVRTQPRVQDLFIFAILVTFFGISSIIILPAVVSRVFGGGAEMLGFLLASSGAGALVGAILVTPLAQRSRRTGRMLAACVLWSGAWLVLLSFTRAFPSAAVAIFFVSLTIPVVMTTANGLLQIMAPPNMRARLLSLMIMASFGAQPAAAILIGVVADTSLGPMGAILMNGALMIASALLLAAFRSGLLAWEVRPMASGPPVPSTAK
jgi:predicted MFS family arabinose efflux permease